MNEVATKKEVELPEPVARRGISEPQWRTLANNLYPGANVISILMVWDYCVARKLDPLKKPCHIVPMEVKDARTGEKSWRDVILPGVYELRTTAMRSHLYLGHSKPEYGPDIKFLGTDVPAWCQITVYRWNEKAQMKGEFPVIVHFSEVAATTRDYSTKEMRLNARWSKAPVQMLTKCTEAAALREAFPDELGGVQTEEEMRGQEMIDITPTAPAGKLHVALQLHKETIERIKGHLAFEEYKQAYDLWNSIPEEDRNSLWVAPTKFEEAPFTTEERAIIKSDKFNLIGRTPDLGIGTIDVNEDVAQ